LVQIVIELSNYNPGSVKEEFLMMLLNLPPEIREKIYILICSHPTPYVPLSYTTEPAHPSYPHNLLLTNAQLYQELRPIYFLHNTFSLTLRRRNDDLDYFLSPSFLDNRRQIHNLRIVILRWGTRDFFCRRLVPVLEDCVLNGRLRRVEVIVKEVFLKGLGNREAGGEEFENWRTLRKLCSDPYLEKVVLRAGPLDEWVENVDGEDEVDISRYKDVSKLLKDPEVRLRESQGCMVCAN